MKSNSTSITCSAALASIMLGLMSSAHAATFTDVTLQAGITHTQWRNDDPSLPFKEVNFMSGGAAAGDC